MITSNYLLQVLPELEEFNVPNLESHIHLTEGFDGVIALLENIRTGGFPCVIIEDKTIGNISIDDGPLDTYCIPLWIMLQDVNMTPSELFPAAFELLKKIIKLLIRDNETELLEGLDCSRLSYNKRFAADAYGYEVLLTFRKNIDLAL